jgi:hypothetical protein
MVDFGKMKRLAGTFKNFQRPDKALWVIHINLRIIIRVGSF